MLDIIGKSAGDAASQAIIEQMRTLYRARPFTKSIPFNQTLNGADPVAIWSPNNGHFEVAHIYIRCDTVGIDLSICDSTTAQPFAFSMPPTTEYEHIDTSPGYRSLLAQNAQLLIFDPAATGTPVIKGFILGWEVTKEGYYR